MIEEEAEDLRGVVVTGVYAVAEVTGAAIVTEATVVRVVHLTGRVLLQLVQGNG